MATVRHMELSHPPPCGVFCDEVKPESAQVADELLQEVLEKFHIFFEPKALHNHLMAHILTLYALGATPEQIRAAFERNKVKQHMGFEVDENAVQAISDKTKWKDFVGRQEHYPNFLAYFQREVESKGLGETLQEHLFAEDDHANDLLARMFSGYLHPLIRLGFGAEWGQPAIIATALAEAAVHDDVVREYLLQAEKKSRSVAKEDATQNPIELLHKIRADEKLCKAAQWTDESKLRDGVLKRAWDEMIKYASQYIVSPDRLQEATAQMTNATAYMTGSAQNPPKQVKFDFSFIHAFNCSIFFPSLLSLPYISQRAKIRLLEWKVRCDISMYAAHNAPKLVMSPIIDYEDERDWRTLFDMIITQPQDDGHMAKTMRAIASGQRICEPFEKSGRENGFFITDDMWLKIGNLLIDSLSNTGGWIALSGFEQAWGSTVNQSGM